MRFRIFLPGAIILAVCLVFSQPASASFSMRDGGTLGPGRSAIHAKLGVPHLGLDYLAGLHETLDVGGGLLINYLDPTFEPGILLRWQIAGTPNANIALTSRAAVHWNLGLWRERRSPPNVGLRFTPGIAAGLRPHPVYSGYVSFEAPFLLTFAHDGGWAVPLRAAAGLEYGMSPNTRFVVHGGAGPRFEGGGGHVGGVFLESDIWLGLSVSLF